MKKVLALVLALALVLSMTACSKKDDSSKTPEPTKAVENTAKQEEKKEEPKQEEKKEEPKQEEKQEESKQEEAPAAGGNVTLWVAEAVVDFTKAQTESFKAANPEYAGWTFSVEPVGEGDAAGNMITDVDGGADIFGFAQDQLSRLVAAGAVTPITGDYATWIETENDGGAVGAATVGDKLYAFPMTSDNGYFLYYDKSVVTDPSTLEGIVAACEAAGKNFYFEINSGWYQTAFFFGTGAELTYDTDASGAFTACNCDYASDTGVAALKAMINLAASPAFKNGSSVDNATDWAAIVDGTWDSGNAQSYLGDNYACAKLPTFTVDGQTYQMSGFSGNKLLGVKPQSDAAKLDVCLKLAQYLTGSDVQLARFKEVGWGPSNLAAQGSDAVTADPALSALAQQLNFCIPQGQYPGDYWGLATALGDDVINGTTTASSDLNAVLQQFQDTCASYVQ